MVCSQIHPLLAKENITLEIHIETNRLLLREIVPSDANALFKLDSNTLVNKYLGNKPVQSLQQSRDIIDFITEQYYKNGIGRLAVIEKQSGLFIGWSGLKLETNIRTEPYYDLGYRFLPEFWGNGYATESVLASLDYGFTLKKYPKICAAAHIDNQASNTVLNKVGMDFIESFSFDDAVHNWYELPIEKWLLNKNSYI